MAAACVAAAPARPGGRGRGGIVRAAAPDPVPVPDPEPGLPELLRLAAARGLLGGAPGPGSGGGGGEVPAHLEGTRRLYGEAGVRALGASTVLVLGLGGVGSWAAEALARAGVGRLVLVDLDAVCASNINRQAHALHSTVGRPKVAATAARLRDISPAWLAVEAVEAFADASNLDSLLARVRDAPGPGFVLDATDDAPVKALCVHLCREQGLPVVTCGGAAGARAPDALRVADLALTERDPLLRRVRKRLRREHGWRTRTRGSGGKVRPWKVPAVSLPTLVDAPGGGGAGRPGNCGEAGGAGSAVHVTASMGFFAAGHIVNALVEAGSTATPGAGGEEDEAGGSRGDGDGGGAAPHGSSSDDPSQSRKEGADQGGGEEEGDPAAPPSPLPAEVGELMRTAVDSHCHLQLDDGFDPASTASSLGLRGLALMATEEADWGPLLEATESHRGSPTEVRVGLGVHPWWAHQASGRWLEELGERLARHPAATVGEIGLDKLWVPKDTGRGVVEYAAQLEVFKAQLALAAELGRPATVHCVRAFGDLADILRAAPALPPRIYLHSYGGTAEMAKSFWKMKNRGSPVGDRFFFGFSSIINRRSPKTPAVIRSVPEDRLLLESDVSRVAAVEAELRQSLELIATAKGWSLERALGVCNRNSDAFFRDGATAG